MSTFKNADLGKLLQSEAEGPLKVLHQKVFNNALILDCIFGYLTFDDIKRLRQVCVQWNKVAIPFLKKLGVIFFKIPGHSLQYFNRVFRNSEMGTDFPSVKITHAQRAFDRDISSDWTISKFTKLLENRKTTMKELSISPVYLGLDGKISFVSFDITEYIDPSLTKLDIDRVIPKIIISVDRCTSTKVLMLQGCQLQIASAIKIKPVELILKHNTIKQTGTANISSLNELINFDRLKCISVHSVRLVNNDGAYGDNLSLHFRDPITVKKVDINGKNLNLDFENAKWKITEKLSLSFVEFTTPKGIEFSNLEFAGALLDLSVLPVNLRRLKISNEKNTITRTIASNPISLPELEFLHLKVKQTDYQNVGTLDERNMPWISHFKNRENLKTLMLTFQKSNNPDYYHIKVDIGNLPKSIQKLFISGNFEFTGNCSKSNIILLQQLHMQKTNPTSLNSIIRRFKGEQLVADLRNFEDDPSVYKSVINISKRPFKSIAVALNHQESSYLASRLSKCTDKFSEFYIFVDKLGTAISQSQFEELFDEEEKMHDEITDMPINCYAFNDLVHRGFGEL